MNKQKKHLQLVNIRALAIVLVVLGHSIILYSNNWNLYETNNQVPILDCFKRCIDIIQMPLFFSLSGYLFVFSRDKRNINELFLNKVKRLLIPFIVVACIFMVPLRLLVRYPGYEGKSYAFIIMHKIINSTDVGHLWFLPALFIIFILSKIILDLCRLTGSLEKISDIILFFIGVILYFEGWKIGFGVSSLLDAFSYFMYFSLGYMICFRRNFIKKYFDLLPIKIIMTIISVILWFYCIKNGEAGVLISLLTRYMLVFMIYLCMPKQTFSIIEKIDKNSFGIYLIHSPLIYITYAYMSDMNPMIVVIMNFVIFGAVAFWITELLRKMHLGVVIGE